jgi:hypothetical protein
MPRSAAQEAPPPSSINAALHRIANPFCDSALRNAHEQLRADVPSVHGEVFAGLRATIERVRQDGRSRLQMVLGDPGEGKTHLLARLRRLAEASWSDRTAPPLALGVVAPVRDPARPFRHILRDAASSLGRPILPPVLRDDPQPGSQLERLAWLILARGLAHLAESDESVADWGQDRVPRYLASFAVRVREEWPERGADIARRLLPWAEAEQIAPELWQAICRLPVAGSAGCALSWMRGSLLPEAELDHHGLPPPIDDEDLAFRVLVSLARGSGVPLVLGFDQVEGVRRQGEEAVRQLFSALSELFNQDGRLALLVFCQTTIWAEMVELIEQQVLDRMERSQKLRALTEDEVVALCASRLQRAYAVAGVVPPHEIYPFGAEALRAERRAGRLATPREVFKYLERLWDDRPAEAATDPEARARASYEEILERERRALFDRTPEVRAAMVRHALQQALDAARLAGREVAGARVVRTAAQGGRGQESPLQVVLARGGIEKRLYIETSNSTNGSSAAASVRRLKRALQKGEADVGLLLREQSFSLPPSAHDQLQRTPRAAVVWLHNEELPPLSALEAFLNGAPENEIPPAQAQALCTELAPGLQVLCRVVAETFAPEPRAAAPADPQLVRRVEEYLAWRRQAVDEARLCEALGVPREKLHSAIEVLRGQGRVVVMMDADQGRTIASRREGAATKTA